MKSIIIDGTEYKLTPVNKTDWIKQVTSPELEWGPVTKKQMTWQEAVDWCKEQGGRLPTSAELLTAYEVGVSGFNKNFFWSATTYPNTSYQNVAMVVNFNDGYVVNDSKAGSGYVRCVREINSLY